MSYASQLASKIELAMLVYWMGSWTGGREFQREGSEGDGVCYAVVETLNQLMHFCSRRVTSVKGLFGQMSMKS